MEICFASIALIQEGDKFSLMQCLRCYLKYRKMEKKISYTFVVGSLM